MLFYCHTENLRGYDFELGTNVPVNALFMRLAFSTYNQKIVISLAHAEAAEYNIKQILGCVQPEKR